jgi:hypothetical protein
MRILGRRRAVSLLISGVRICHGCFRYLLIKIRRYSTAHANRPYHPSIYNYRSRTFAYQETTRLEPNDARRKHRSAFPSLFQFGCGCTKGGSRNSFSLSDPGSDPQSVVHSERAGQVTSVINNHNCTLNAKLKSLSFTLP